MHQQSNPLCSSDEEGHSFQDHLWAHALHSIAHSQIQLSREGELRGVPQVTERLQTLKITHTSVSKLSITKKLTNYRIYCISVNLYHNRMSLFSCSSVETAQDLQHKRPRGMKTIGQSFLHNTERDRNWTLGSPCSRKRWQYKKRKYQVAHRNIFRMQAPFPADVFGKTDPISAICGATHSFNRVWMEKVKVTLLNIQETKILTNNTLLIHV